MGPFFIARRHSVMTVFLVLLMFLVLVVVVIVVITATVMTITGLGTDRRPGRTTDPGTDQLTTVASHALAEGGTTQCPHGATDGRLILVAAIGPDTAPGSPTDGSTDQGASITTQLFADDRPGGTTGPPSEHSSQSFRRQRRYATKQHGQGKASESTHISSIGLISRMSLYKGPLV